MEERPPTKTPLTPEQARMVEDNLRLVWWAVNRFGGRGKSDDERDEMYADGVFGPMRAAQLYDPSTGYRFSTYALAWLRQSMQRGREQRLGKAFRRAARHGLDYEAPVSLDQEYGDEVTLADTLVATDDPEVQVVARVTLEEVVGKLHRHCRDDFDHDLVATLAADKPRQARFAVAEKHGFHPESSRQRVSRLKSYLVA